MFCCGMGASQSLPQAKIGTVELKESANPEQGLGAIRRGAAYSDKLHGYFYEDAKTLYEVFQRGLRVSRDKPCFGYRPVGTDGKVGPYKWFTYQEVREMADAVGSGVLHLDLVPESDDGHKFVGIYSKNCYQWGVVEQACNAYKLVLVPLYDTLGPDACSFILNQTNISTVFVAASELNKLLSAKRDHGDQVSNLRHIIQFEDVSKETREEAEALGLTLRSLAELQEVGRANHKIHCPPKADELAFISYTSGTTGNPKGVMTLHKNLVADASGALRCGINIDNTDVHLSYLPLAHSFERLVFTFMLMNGARVGFFQGDVRKITEDLCALRPTVFPSVPRLYNRIYDKVVGGAQAAGGAKAALFNKGFEAKRYWLKRNHLHHKFWDTLVFHKVAKKVGLDRCKLMLTGSAPIAPHVMEFLRCVFSCAVLEGYGQTECSAAATVTSLSDQSSIGHVGAPLACNEVRLVSVDEMGYSVTDEWHGREEKDGKIVRQGIRCQGRGEICYRGPNVFEGYYKDPEKTREALDEDGWLHSGDIGLWDVNGNLRIIDRKKNIFKLSQGEYVAAEKVENAYARSSMVAQIFVHGDSFQSCLVAIVVPDEEYVMGPFVNSAEGSEFKGRSFEDICADASFKRIVEADMEKAAKTNELRGFEKVKAIHIDTKAWTPEDLLTPSFKLKRNVARKQYQDQIDAMYASGIGVVAGQTGIRQGEAIDDK